MALLSAPVSAETGFIVMLPHNLYQMSERMSALASAFAGLAERSASLLRSRITSSAEELTVPILGGAALLAFYLLATRLLQHPLALQLLERGAVGSGDLLGDVRVAGGAASPM